VRSASSRLLHTLLCKGLVSSDPLGLGLRANSSGAVLDAGGRVDPRLFVLGPLRRGELWETTAVGEIRAQARDVAAQINRSAIGASDEASDDSARVAYERLFS
jgi:uncharacterized NAD(P)/FAD-binding protein YdhS